MCIDVLCIFQYLLVNTGLSSEYLCLKMGILCVFVLFRMELVTMLWLDPFVLWLFVVFIGYGVDLYVILYGVV